MPEPYQMKDFGYERKPAVGNLVVSFSNGEKWAVPLQVICDSRDENYKDDEEDTFKFVTEGGLTPYDIEDWAAGNMNWSDLAPYATKINSPTPHFDYEDGWCSASKDAEIPKELFAKKQR